MMRNVISFCHKFLKILQKYLLGGEKVFLILALPAWFAFICIKQLGQSILKYTSSKLFIIKTQEEGTLAEEQQSK